MTITEEQIKKKTSQLLNPRSTIIPGYVAYFSRWNAELYISEAAVEAVVRLAASKYDSLRNDVIKDVLDEQLSEGFRAIHLKRNALNITLNAENVVNNWGPNISPQRSAKEFLGVYDEQDF